ncbi:M23 family metallopeptidase [Chitinilyticum aquatile]|uniref:M23 family metallopeptidase n=1 Tax=Chitinilyticum aquatile TaxID=362520 RepID=UPI0003FF7E0A|nr:peptidoglycan DD-metalloendopeptidase family protein [Chitinilyticum aquatile]
MNWLTNCGHGLFLLLSLSVPLWAAECPADFAQTLPESLSPKERDLKCSKEVARRAEVARQAEAQKAKKANANAVKAEAEADAARAEAERLRAENARLEKELAQARAVNAPVVSKPTPVVQNSGSAVAASPKVASTTVAAEAGSVDWGWPTAGKVTTGFTEQRKGVDIAGKMGQSVVASAGGNVVYAGSGMKGYGKAVIVQHGNGYLSTYAHNSKLLVKEGDIVKKGEKIAEMGNSDAEEIKLHFEIRKFGKPVDPTKYISVE